MMKRLMNNRLLAIVALLFMLISCEEVIHLELKNVEPRMVIEATLNGSDGTCSVRVSQSLDFYQTDSLGLIRGAEVMLAWADGEPVRLAESTPGLYTIAGLNVAPDITYRISVRISADEVYEAEAIAPDPVFLDSLKVVRGFGDPRPTAPPVFLINPIWTDPAGKANFYRFKVTTNGELSGGFNITSDEPFDGTVVDLPLFRYGFSLLDTVRLEFQTIDSLSFAYFNQINDMARPSFVSATPYNPVGNFNHGALGYFGIFFAEIRDLVIIPGK